MTDRVWTPDGPGVVKGRETRQGRTWINVAGNGFSGWYANHEVTAEIGEGQTVSLSDLPDLEDGARLPWDPEPRDLFHNQLNIQPIADLPPNLTETDSIQGGLRNYEPTAVFGAHYADAMPLIGDFENWLSKNGYGQVDLSDQATAQSLPQDAIQGFAQSFGVDPSEVERQLGGVGQPGGGNKGALGEDPGNTWGNLYGPTGLFSSRTASIDWKQDSQGGYTAQAPDGSVIMVHPENGEWVVSGSSPLIQQLNSPAMHPDGGFPDEDSAMEAIDQAAYGTAGNPLTGSGDPDFATDPNYHVGSGHPFGKVRNARHFQSDKDDTSDDEVFNDVVPHDDDDVYKQVDDSYMRNPGLDDYGDDYDEKNSVENGGDGPFDKSSSLARLIFADSLDTDQSFVDSINTPSSGGSSDSSSGGDTSTGDFSSLADPSTDTSQDSSNQSGGGTNIYPIGNPLKGISNPFKKSPSAGDGSPEGGTSGPGGGGDGGGGGGGGGGGTDPSTPQLPSGGDGIDDAEWSPMDQAAPAAGDAASGAGAAAGGAADAAGGAAADAGGSIIGDIAGGVGTALEDAAPALMALAISGEEMHVNPSKDGFQICASSGEPVSHYFSTYHEAAHVAKFAAYEAFLDRDPMARQAAWADVRKKALRLRRDGAIKVTYYEPKEIEGEVKGDNGNYDASISRKNAFGNGVTYYNCSCPWGQWAFKRQYTYVGRFCSHGLALYHEMQSLDNSGARAFNDAMNPFLSSRQAGLFHHDKGADYSQMSDGDLLSAVKSLRSSNPDSPEARAAINAYQQRGMDHQAGMGDYLHNLENKAGDWMENNFDDEPLPQNLLTDDSQPTHNDPTPEGMHGHWLQDNFDDQPIPNDLMMTEPDQPHHQSAFDPEQWARTAGLYLADSSMLDDTDDDAEPDSASPSVVQIPQNPSHAIDPEDGQMEVFSDDPLQGTPVEHVRDDGGDASQMGDPLLQGQDVPHDPLAGSGSATPTDDLGNPDQEIQMAQMAHDMQEMQMADQRNVGGDDDIAVMARTFLARTSAKNYSLAEQEELMHESGKASQLNSLNLQNSLYEEPRFDVMFFE